MAPTAEEAQYYIDYANQMITELQEGIDYLKANVDDPVLLAKVDEFYNKMLESRDDRNKLFELSLKVMVDEAIDLYFDSYNAVTIYCASLCESYRSINYSE